VSDPGDDRLRGDGEPEPHARPPGCPRSVYRDRDGHVWHDLAPWELTTAVGHAAAGGGQL
jgi:hypothetical protein